MYGGPVPPARPHMGLSRRRVALFLVGAAALLATHPYVARLFGQPSESTASSSGIAGQEQAPNRPEFTLIAKDYHYSPDRLEVSQDDLVKVTIRSEDVAYSFAIDEYRIVRRVPAGASTTFEFRADRAGTFRFYSNLTSEPGHGQMQGQLVVRAKA